MFDHPTPAPTAAPDLTDFHTFKHFARDFERQKLGSVQSLRWLARFRETNGLLASGAMVELKTPGATRPRLLVNRPRFAQWLATQSTAVAA
ncbi:hypothetical protein [uncultured Lamprocystis sp.]|jgi:hypothetical protein|uniref:hypothetical protein n=1 Tax=uncultured Lamprocystis sp. TaxID=543132 RepID=UPI0025E87A26|nr:hypothetical protein [uncultured Lamprocystis sp.]